MNGIIAQTPEWRPVESAKCQWSHTAEENADFHRKVTVFWAVTNGVAGLLPTRPVSCGNRVDLPKRQRRHVWEDRGLDVRHDPDSGVYRLRRVFACDICGRDKDENPSRTTQKEH